MTAADVLAAGLAHHRAGQLDQAERCYRQVLQEAPQQSDALHLLGVVAFQTGHHEAAVELVRSAIANRPTAAEYHNNLGQPLERLARWSEAEASYRQAIRLKPDYAEALNNLGNVLRERGALAEAVASYRRALALQPDYADARSNLGAALLEQRDPDAALVECQRAVELNPRLGRAHNNLGNALKAQQRLEAALDAYRTAATLEPGLPEAPNNAGAVLLEWRRFAEAAVEFEQAIALKPDYVDAYLNLANAWLGLEQFERAAKACAEAVRRKPDRADAHVVLGAVLLEQKQIDDAIRSFRTALALQPTLPEAHNNLAVALKLQGRLDEAIASFRAALEHNPGYSVAHSGLLFTLLSHPSYDARAQLAEHRRWHEAHAARIARLAPPRNSRDPERRLRIGYVSADLCNHAVGRNVHPLLRHHDHARWEVIAFAHVFQPDAITAQLRAGCDEWHDIVALDDAQLADLIRSRQIDVLVDLHVHTNQNRLLAFARRPAPVQVTFAGYPGTTGLSAMDYRLTDRYLDPPGQHDDHYTERSLRLPHSFWCFDPIDGRPELAPRRAGQPITWGSLNNPTKLNAAVLGWWARILAGTPDSRLLTLAYNDSDRERIASGLAAHGIARGRLEFVSGQTRLGYLETYRRCDVILDTFPYNGHTTGCDALWMGVPIVTLAGDTAVSRAGLSLLSNLGLTELVAATPDDYVRIALELARAPARLAELHATLRARMERSPLMDGAQFARDIEAALRGAWREWCERPAA